ncbi:MAG TPA: hypothetical protein VLB80_04610 [Candidatus Babeliales bacterium]|nr:hypothetical protein [Candidatus Babeliales bacterium]
MIDACDYHKNMENPFDIEHSLFSAQVLKETLDKNEQMYPTLQPFLNKELLNYLHAQEVQYKNYGLQYAISINSEILKIEFISPDNVVIYLRDLYEKTSGDGKKKYQNHQIYKGNINELSAWALILSREGDIAMHIIRTTSDNFVVLIEYGKKYIHSLMHRIIKYTRHVDYSWMKNKYNKVLRYFSLYCAPGVTYFNLIISCKLLFFLFVVQTSIIYGLFAYQLN